MRLAVATAHFGRDVAFNIARAGGLIADARARAVELLVLPHGLLSGYHDRLDGTPVGSGDGVPADLPDAHAIDGPEVVALARAAGDVVVCFGITERVGDRRANTAVCVHDGAVLGTHRKVHLPRGEVGAYVAGDAFDPIDTPVGRLGMLVDYDKTFPEAARTLALRGAEVLAVPCAWPASRTNRAQTLVRDRQRRLFDLYDQARAAENQVWVASANQTGRHGELRFLGLSKVVAPDGAVVLGTGTRAGLAVHDADVSGAVRASRRRFHHLAERRPDGYEGPWSTTGAAAAGTDGV